MSSKLLSERIKEIRGSLNKAEFAKSLGVSPSYITELEGGAKENISGILAELISVKYGINKDWLLTGEGKKENPYPFAGPEIIFDQADLVEVPVYALAGAGAPRSLVSNEPIDNLIVPKNFMQGHIVPVRIRGQSMENTLNDGATVGIDTADIDIISGKIYAVWLDYEGAVIKRLFVEPDRIALKSDNPQFSPSFINKKDIGEYFILGRVKWVIQKL